MASFQRLLQENFYLLLKKHIFNIILRQFSTHFLKIIVIIITIKRIFVNQYYSFVVASVIVLVLIMILKIRKIEEVVGEAQKVTVKIIKEENSKVLFHKEKMYHHQVNKIMMMTRKKKKKNLTMMKFQVTMKLHQIFEISENSQLY